MKKKDGRPPRRIAAWRSLHALQELKHFPEVLSLIETLQQNVDPNQMAEALEEALSSLKVANGRRREPLPPNATVEQRQLHAAAEVERLNQDRHTLGLLAAAVNAELQTATSELERAETVLRTVAHEREPVDRYERDVARKLRAAGLTIKAARTMNDVQMSRIRDAMDGADVWNSVLPEKPARRPAEVALAWRDDNPWRNLETEHYELVHSPMREAEEVLLRRCGLPPSTYLKDFGNPYLLAAFEAATDPNAQERACWEICAQWISENVVDELASQRVVADMRRDAWTFLFGVRYEFAHQVKRLARVEFPSPRDPGERVLAHLKRCRSA